MLKRLQYLFDDVKLVWQPFVEKPLRAPVNDAKENII
jgi:hypothetical protein